MADPAKAERQRLDKWLWFARFAKTRSLAARLVAEGHVRVNGKRAEAPAKGILVGDVVTVAAAHVTALVRVAGLGERRGPAPEARLLYVDLTKAEPGPDQP
ncbi:RNA-binding S4 domain-containing protein [Methylobacterium nigriterrae]|uniref:RNA-binding S4 domain-containing protein n=1 Tax=Methylobacterium nigriterrae TaxID=3127512 RepID=UPI0030137D7C